MSLRNDAGALWENLMIAERLKKAEYNQDYYNHYFWRTSRQQEIDLIEEGDGNLYTYEFKWSPAKTVKPPVTFVNAYPRAKFEVITKKNFFEFL